MLHKIKPGLAAVTLGGVGVLADERHLTELGLLAAGRTSSPPPVEDSEAKESSTITS